MSVLAQLRQIAEAAPAAPRPRAPARPAARAEVEESTDLERILALPRRPIPSPEEQEAMARSMSERLRRFRTTPCDCAKLRPEVVARGQNPCITELRPVQGWYLHEASTTQGLLGFIPVGGGKTLVGALTAMVVPGCKLAVLLIPPGLRAQFLNDFKTISQHFQTPNLRGGPGPFVVGRPALELFAYSELSHEKNSTWLKTRNPDVVLADEVHALKAGNKSARCGRFLRYIAENPHVRFFCHSGSLTTRGLRDYSHLSAIALRDGSPLPLDPGTVDDWADALDPDVLGPGGNPGALRSLCLPGESVRKGFHRRLVQTSGVVATADASCSAALVYRKRKPPPMPAAVATALADVRQREQRPDGEELIDAFEVAAVARQVACGFYLFWRFPNGEPEPLILDWFEKRQNWHRELRERLKHRSDHMDSPKLLRDAAIRWHGGTDAHINARAAGLPMWRAGSWPAWRDIADAVQPVTDVKWISDWLVRDAVAWGQENTGIIWTENSAVGRLAAKLGGFPYYGAGDEAALGIARETGQRTIVASRRAHGVGRNLQSFCRTLFLQLPSDGGAFEQALGRMHRPGQPADEVATSFYQHTAEYSDALTKAKAYCLYTQETTGVAQKLLSGDWWPASRT